MSDSPMPTVITHGGISRSPEIGELAKALAKAQAGFGRVLKLKTAEVKGRAKKSGKEYSYEYNYADLAAVLEVSMPAMHEAGLVLTQHAARSGSNVSVDSVLIHGESGQWMASTLSMAGGDGTPQDVGKAITYARRYAAQALLGLAAEDDDGKGPTEAHRKAEEERRAREAREAKEWEEADAAFRESLKLLAEAGERDWKAVLGAEGVTLGPARPTVEELEAAREIVMDRVHELDDTDPVDEPGGY